VTNEEVSAEVTAWNGDTETEIPVGQMGSQGAVQNPSPPATDPGTGDASEISKWCAYPVVSDGSHKRPAQLSVNRNVRT
jgi:hypothetical protein